MFWFGRSEAWMHRRQHHARRMQRVAEPNLRCAIGRPFARVEHRQLWCLWHDYADKRPVWCVEASDCEKLFFFLCFLLVFEFSRYFQPSNCSWVGTPAYPNSLAAKADIYTIMLGTNDSKFYNWFGVQNNLGDSYVLDYLELVKRLRSLSSDPLIIPMIPIPGFSV